MMNITFVDLETTGLNPDKHEITELAAIKTEIIEDTINILDFVEYKVKPTLPVDPFIANLNGYDEHSWNDQAVPLEKALGRMFSLMRDSWFAGSNPKFDESFLRVAADKFNWSFPKLASYHLIDVSVLAFPLFLKGKVQKLKQENIAQYFDIKGEAHRAMSDAKQCMEIFAKLQNLKVQY